jgi:hypothetical protein
MARRAGANQPLMIEIGAAECSHEKIIRKRVVFRPLHEAQFRVAKIAHGPAADTGHCREHVVAAAIDLLLIMVEGVSGIQQDRIRSTIHRRGVDPERRVRQCGEAWIGPAVPTEDHQMLQRLAIMIELRPLLVCCVVDSVSAGEKSKEVIEAAIFRIDHHNGLDLGQCLVAPGLYGPANRRDDRKGQQPSTVGHSLPPS